MRSPRGSALPLALGAVLAAAACGGGGGGSAAPDAGVDALDPAVDAGEAAALDGAPPDDAGGGDLLDRRGTPVIVDPGTGRARAAAGYYRVAVEAWRSGLSFPVGRRTVIDFYYGSDQQVLSTGLGGRLMRVPSSGTAAVYAAAFGEDLHLFLDHAQAGPTFSFMTAVLKERGPTKEGRLQLAYPGLVNRIAPPPFAGGPMAAPAGRFVPPFFASAKGTHTLTCTEKTVAGGPDDSFTEGRTYTLVVAADGSVRLDTDRGPFLHTFDEAYDTHLWPNEANETRVQLSAPGSRRTTRIEYDLAQGGLTSVTVSVTGSTFASYTLTP